MWVRVESDFFYHPKTRGLDDATIALHFRALTECAQWRFDGKVPKSFIRTKRQAGSADKLVDRRLWHTAKNLKTTCPECWTALKEDPGDGWVIHDYLCYQPSKEELERKSAAARAVRVAGGQARASSAARDGGRFAPADHQQDTSRQPAEPTSIDPLRPIESLRPEERGQPLVNDEGLAKIAALAGAVGKPMPSVSPTEVRVEASRAYGRALTRGELA